jgi:hypothetical protein
MNTHESQYIKDIEGNSKYLQQSLFKSIFMQKPAD